MLSHVLRRFRGFLLRFVRRRAAAVSVGLVLVLFACWVEIDGRGPWWGDGLALVVGATGAAIAWTGLTGHRPDWIDEGDDRR